MLKSLFNFRAIGGPLFNEVAEEVDPNPLGVIAYRCGRPDNINNEDLAYLQSKLGIKYFLDFRSFENEYNNESGPKLLDSHAELPTLNVVDMEKMERKKLKNIVWLVENNSDNEPENSVRDTQSIRIQHNMANLIGYDFVMGWLADNRCGVRKKIWAVFLMLLYFVYDPKYFVAFFEHEVKKGGLLYLYKSTIDFCGVAIRSVLQLILQEGKVPFVICCHAGKDRTGIMSAILLSICGFDRETIAADFELSERGLSRNTNELLKYSDEMRTAPARVMLDLLDYIDEQYGSMGDYLTFIGISLKEQEKLRKIILIEN